MKMNQQDRDELNSWWAPTTSFQDGLYMAGVRDHAYQLGLKRGQENCAELLEAMPKLGAVIAWLNHGGNQLEAANALRIQDEKARAVIAKFQGENHE